MDNKRKCADDGNEAGTSANKRCKPTANDETDPNSLVGMPDDILDEIFDLLDLSDRKSLAETCKRLNEYFSQVGNLKKVWLNTMTAGPKLTKPMSSRRYTHRNVIYDLSNPKKFVEYFSPTSDKMKGRISSLQLQQQIDVMIVVTHLLPRFFGNLTHLEFTSITGIRWGNGITELNSQLNFDRVAMPHLEFLSIYRKLFAFLDRQFIDFSTEKLHTIKVSEDFDFRPYSYRRYDAQARSEYQLDIDNRIRALIAKQKNLKVLILSVSENFFDRELVVQSKLKTFRVHYHHYHGRRRWMHELGESEQTRENLVEFIVSQTELEDVKAKISRQTFDDQRLQLWQPNRLNSKIKVMSICWSSPNYSSDILLSVLSVNESMLTGEPNLAVRKLKLKVGSRQQTSDTSSFIIAIAAKFPKTQVMHLNVSYGGYNMMSYDLSMLNRLAELTEVHVEDDCWGLRSLESATLPKLRCFGFIYHSSDEDKVRKFLVRHSATIKEIHIHDPDSYVQLNVINWLKFALKSLKHLELIKCCRHERLPLTQSDIKNISSLIAAHAQPGFRLNVNKLKLLKRADKKVVLETGGSWEMIELASNFKPSEQRR